MTDIVEKLNQGIKEGVDGWWGTMEEAAEEIVKLRLSLRHMAAWVKHWQEDRLCDLKPTPESLAEAAEMIRTTLNSEA